MYKKRKCPICGEKELVEIVYGYPGKELFEVSENGLVILGGCCIEDDGPYSIENFFCHNCRKRINLDRENMKKDKLFRYIEKDAWGIDCHEDILIRDSKKDNVILHPDFDLPLTFSIDYDDILKIKGLINEGEYLFKIRKAQGPDWICDGSIHEVYFWNKENFNKIETYNLDKWEGNVCKYRNTKILLKVIKEISKILEKYEINLLKGC